MIEYPEDPRASSTPSQPVDPEAAAAYATELWLRRELAFLYGVERRIRRSDRWRREAWRGVAVTSILAVFALCWYLAAVASSGTGSRDCASKAASTTTASAAHSAAASTAADAKSCNA